MECKDRKNIDSSNINDNNHHGKLIHRVIIISITAVALIVLGVTIAFQYIGLKYVSKVRNGHFDRYPAITVGEAFKQTFEKSKWHHKEEEGEHIVTFTGKYQSNGEKQEITATFKVDSNDGQFGIYELDIDGVKQDDETTIKCLDDIFKNIKPESAK